MAYPHQVNEDLNPIGSTLRFSSPEVTTVLPKGEYEGEISSICPWEIIVHNIRRTDGEELPREYNHGDLHVAFRQAHPPSPGLKPNCPRISRDKQVRFAGSTRPEAIERRPSLSKGRALRRRDGTIVPIKKYRWL
jgi:hypothetical protein